MKTWIESRATKFIDTVNLRVEDEKNKLPVNDFEVALGIVSLVAASEEKYDSELYDRAFEVAEHLRGASIAQIARNPTLTHLQPYSYSTAEKNRSITRVAKRASELINGTVETSSEIPTLISTVEDLAQKRLVTEPIAKGLLVMFDEVDVSQASPEAVQIITKFTTKHLLTRMESNRRNYPYLNRIVGSTTDGIRPKSVEELIEERLKYLSSSQDAKLFVKTQISLELRKLYSASVY